MEGVDYHLGQIYARGHVGAAARYGVFPHKRYWQPWESMSLYANITTRHNQRKCAGLLLLLIRFCT
ncbi:hypothetical protein Leryth_016999 [Lithospermum erythrorhizon]|nr:hypothetical protein Leryth_016999 [Lithospermum erythrorhizon]